MSSSAASTCDQSVSFMVEVQLSSKPVSNCFINNGRSSLLFSTYEQERDIPTSYTVQEYLAWKPVFLFSLLVFKPLLFNCFFFLENCSLPWMISSMVTQTNQNWTNPRVKVSGESFGKSPLGSAAVENILLCRIQERIQNLIQKYICILSQWIQHHSCFCVIPIPTCP